MPFNEERLDKYFERIGYDGSRSVSEKTLRDIHVAQLFTIPFENLSIQESKNANTTETIIHLDQESLFNKLVLNRRGGYCHENNELLALVLLSLGFKVDRLAARVLTEPNLSITHKLLLVTIGDKQWIADVGFGASGIYEPLSLDTEQTIHQYKSSFRLTQERNSYTLEVYQNQSWVKLYEFNKDPVKAIDFEPMNYYVSHHPASIFVQNRICVLPTPDGIITLKNNQLKIKSVNGKEQITLKDGDEYLADLKKYFGIALPKETQFKPLVACTTVNRHSFFTKAAAGIGFVGALSLVIAKRMRLA
jgi:N-hydroxyarylamine O-acetyltransferase